MFLNNSWKNYLSLLHSFNFFIPFLFLPTSWYCFKVSMSLTIHSANFHASYACNVFIFISVQPLSIDPCQTRSIKLISVECVWNCLISISKSRNTDCLLIQFILFLFCSEGDFPTTACKILFVCIWFKPHLHTNFHQ